jgi:KAP family P-loop domain protein
MNKNIENFLNEYMINPDPQYAVFLKGNWGCGKTFFVNNWLNSYKKKIPEEQILKPVMVSLYGLSEIKQITAAINKALYPILCGRAAKVGKTLTKFLSAIVLKHEVDVDKDNNFDFEIELGLDSVLLLFSSEDNSVKKGKLLIFDDIERCEMPMKRLMGYLNYFVELCHSHLIIIGDERKMTDEQKIIFSDFKEKTIGREFEISTNVRSAIENFTEQEPTSEFIRKHITTIEKVFSMTDCQNLRILRQALWDFGRFEETMIEFSKESKYEHVMLHILGSYIISYCEYRGENHDLLDKWVKYNCNWETTNKDEINMLKQQLGNLCQRYNNSLISTYQTFNISLVEKIITELNTGISIKNFAERFFAPDVENPCIKINDSFSMDNETFLEFYNKLIDDICNLRIKEFRNLGYALTYLFSLDFHKIKEINETDFNRLRDVLPNYLQNITIAENLYFANLEFKRGVNSYMTNDNIERLSIICSTFYNECERRIMASKNIMTLTLENLKDSNVKDLFDINKEALPDHSCTYEMVSIFNSIDISLLFDNLGKLNNASLQTFNSFIRERYKLSHRMGNWIRNTNDDIKPLQELKGKIDSYILNEQLMKKEAFRRISNSLDGAIKRCQGVLGEL